MKARQVGAGVSLALICVLGSQRTAYAHPFRPAVLALKELSPGRFAVSWSPPFEGQSLQIPPQPRFPPHCRVENAMLIDCGERGLVGAIRFGEGPGSARVSVDIEWFQGPRELRLASGEPAELRVSGTPQQASFGQKLELARSYTVMGIKHILSGIDHLMFVAGLLLFVHSPRRLLLTITAFTLAHSVTLAAAALDVVHLPSGPVELSIALSILLLAVEATRKRDTWTHRAPWMVAFVFGLLHGFGFASALAEVGLPPQHRALALASFNIGVEVGQLMSVAAMVLVWRVVFRRVRSERAQSWAVLVLGSASVYWCLERALAMWQQSHG